MRLQRQKKGAKIGRISEGKKGSNNRTAAKIRPYKGYKAAKEGPTKLKIAAKG